MFLLCVYAARDALTRHLRGGLTAHDIINPFPEEVTAICRDALREPDSLFGYFGTLSESGRHRNLVFAINYLKKHGAAADRPLLREYACKSALGYRAIDALKAIEERLASEKWKLGM